MRYTTTLILVSDFYRRRYKLNEDEEAKQEYQASLLILVYKSLYSMEWFQCHKFGSTTEWRYFFENLALCFAFHIPFYSPPNLGYLFCTPRLLACFLDEPCLWGKSPLPRHWFTDWSWIWLLQWVLDFFNNQHIHYLKLFRRQSWAIHPWPAQHWPISNLGPTWRSGHSCCPNHS